MLTMGALIFYSYICFSIFFVVLSVEGLPQVPTVRIVGGQFAKEGEIPFMISLRHGAFHVCGASLISQQWIITAGHCALEQNQSAYSIQYGLLNITTDDNIISVTTIIKYPGFSTKDTENDIALMKLSEPVPLSENVQLANLPHLHEITKPGSNALIAGWGLFSIGGPLSKQLRKVNLTIVDLDECADDYERTPWYIYDTNICAGAPEGGKGQCNADSGGPLIVDNTLVGIVSWSEKPCGIKGFPGVFTRISAFIKWIKYYVDFDS